MNYDSVANKSLITEYNYVNETGVSSGQVLYDPKFYYEYWELSSDGNTTTLLMRIEGDAVFPLFPYMGSPVIYNVVMEKKVSSEGEIRTRHFFTDFDFISTDDLKYANLSLGVPHNKLPSKDNAIGIEYKTQYFNRNPDNSYSVIKTDSSNFEMIWKPQEYTWNVQSAWAFFNGIWTTSPGYDPYSDPILIMAASVNAYKLFKAAPVKVSQYNKYQQAQATVVESSLYQYDEDNSNIKVVKSIKTNGDTVIKMVKYAADFAHTGAYSGTNAEIDKLKDNNILAAPIEIVELLKNKNTGTLMLQDAVLYEYENLKVKKIYRINENIAYASFAASYNNGSGFFKDAHYELEQEIMAFDENKNPLTVNTKSNWVSYVWDSQHDVPIATAANAHYTEIAYTGFEGTESGNWNIPSGERDFSRAVTGLRSYKLSNGNITKTLLNSDRTYFVSYWSNNGQLSVTGSVSAKQGYSANGWTYFEHKIMGVTGITISGTGSIDELRLYPKGALMSSYAFNPLFGMVAGCDQRNVITTYEYQGANKLSLVRDQNRKIIQQYCYNYAGQPENCIQLYKNIPLSKVFVRNNCDTMHTGLPVLYTVPAGTYTSSVSQVVADSLAQLQIDANGQNYANTEGKCRSHYAYGKLVYLNQINDMADIAVEFYEDPALTIPYIANNISVTVHEEVYDDLQGTTTHHEYTIPCNGPQATLLSSVLLIEPTFQWGVMSYLYRTYYLSYDSWYIGQ